MRIRVRQSIAMLVLVAIWLAMLLLGGSPLDQAIYRSLYARDDPLLADVARFVSEAFKPTYLVIAGAAVAALLWSRGRGRYALVVLAVILVGRVLSVAQKYWIQRERPDLEAHLAIVRTTSFPSGHSSNAMIVFLVIAIVLASDSRWRYPAAALALLMAFIVGLSRVMLGVHWPSDVIGGWTFGALWVLLALRPAERLFRAAPDRDVTLDAPQTPGR